MAEDGAAQPRELGPYWVRRHDGHWRIAEWVNDFGWLHWANPGDSSAYADSDFAEIGERAERRSATGEATRQLVEWGKANIDPADLAGYSPASDGDWVSYLSADAKDALLHSVLQKLQTHLMPQPITDAQKTGDRFLVWYTGEPSAQHHMMLTAASLGDRLPRGWYVAAWLRPSYSEGPGWCVPRTDSLTDRAMLHDPSVTHHLPLPPDVKPGAMIEAL